MTTLSQFASHLFETGEAHMDGPPESRVQPSRGLLRVLEAAFARYSCDVCGPRLSFRPDFATKAGEILQASCWFLQDRTSPSEVMLRQLPDLPHDEDPSCDANVDLFFRYLPQVRQRALALSVDDPLTLRLTEMLRMWPLSGVLTRISELPLGQCRFQGHAGLLWLYAERWVVHRQPSWLPEGPVREYVRMVWHELGYDLDHLQSMLAVSDSSATENEQ